jgi:predicted CoA-binding protein
MSDNRFADPEVIKGIITNSKVIAVVGLSDKPERPSNGVASYLESQGYQIIPVNPVKEVIMGKKSYPDLKSVPESIDVVDVFRRGETVGPIVDEAIEVGAKAIWFQEGVVNEAAADKAAKAGLQVVMDRCMLKEHSRLKS